MAQLKKTLLLVLFFWVFCLVMPVVDGKDSSQALFIDFIDIKTRDLLKVLAQHADKSIVVSEKIVGRVTINLKDITWHDALDAVLRSQGLFKREVNNVIMVLTKEEVEKNEHMVLKSQAFNLHHVAASDIIKLLKPGGVLSSYGKSSADLKTNSLVVSDTGSNILEVVRLIKHLDVPAKQIMIEARIVSVDEAFTRELGLQFGGKVFSRGQFNFVINKVGDNSLLDLQLSALESEGRGKVISRPKLLTTDRKSAYIEAGTEIPYQEKTKEGNTSVVFKKAVLSLKVTPEVVARDKISLSLELNQDKVGRLAINGVPTIDTRKINTKVLVHNNETVVLGGIYEWTKSKQVSGLPFLNKIPLLNMFFGKNEEKVEKRELLIFVSPKIIY